MQDPGEQRVAYLLGRGSQVRQVKPALQHASQMCGVKLPVSLLWAEVVDQWLQTLKYVHCLQTPVDRVWDKMKMSGDKEVSGTSMAREYFRIWTDFTYMHKVISFYLLSVAIY